MHEQLGLSRDALHAVIDAFCEDLISSKQLAWADNYPVYEYTLSELMGEIDLIIKVLELVDMTMVAQLVWVVARAGVSLFDLRSFPSRAFTPSRLFRSSPSWLSSTSHSSCQPWVSPSASA